MVKKKVKCFALGGVLGILTAAFYANVAYAGNGATGGGCYNLEIIGQKSKSVDLTGTSGHSLFVGIDSRTKILLTEGAFDVIDRNGADGTAAFQLDSQGRMHAQVKFCPVSTVVK